MVYNNKTEVDYHLQPPAILMFDHIITPGALGQGPSRVDIAGVYSEY